MTLVKWHPVHRLMDRSNDFDRIFSNFFNTDRVFYGQDIKLVPATNIEENNDEYLISAEMPGINKESIKVSFENNVLSITAEKKHEKKNESENYLIRERRYGSYTRSIPVPNGVKLDEIDAHYESGILNVRIPKTEEVKPRQISVKVK
jgi:HSP20 family protein